MPSPIQQPSAQRKLVYFGLILGLFVVNTFFWRGVSSPLTGGQPPAWTVAAQARDLELTEETKGEADLLGATVRLGLTGSRGLAVTILWRAAIEKQKKNEWNELEFLVRSLTKLQPHFLTPWLFQSWNLAYNVSVEADRVNDKYFYISRGVEFLAEGERQNQHHPELRFSIGFYQQHKISQSDEQNVFRCLWQLSCIRPPDRDPGRFYSTDAEGRRTFNRGEFGKFFQEAPVVGGALREELRRNPPGGVVQFLADNPGIPGV